MNIVGIMLPAIVFGLIFALATFVIYGSAWLALAAYLVGGSLASLATIAWGLWLRRNHADQ